MNILLTGATGTIGAEVLRIFAKKGVTNLKALLRNEDRASSVAELGIEPVIGTFENRASLDAALLEVDTMILITSANPHAEEQASNAIDAANAAGAQKIVRISAIKANPNGPTNNTRAHGRTEKIIAESSMSYVFLRPNLFMQNMFMAVDQIGRQGQFSFATGEGKMGMIDAHDIAACAAECALSDQWDGQTLELTGPEAISYHNVAHTLTELSGKTIDYVPMTPSDMYAIIESAGWGNWMAALARDYGTAYASGWGDFTTENVEKITGLPPRSFKTFAEEKLLTIL